MYLCLKAFQYISTHKLVGIAMKRKSKRFVSIAFCESVYLLNDRQNPDAEWRYLKPQSSNTRGMGLTKISTLCLLVSKLRCNNRCDKPVFAFLLLLAVKKGLLCVF